MATDLCVEADEDENMCDTIQTKKYNYFQKLKGLKRHPKNGNYHYSNVDFVNTSKKARDNIKNDPAKAYELYK